MGMRRASEVEGSDREEEEARVLGRRGSEVEGERRRSENVQRSECHCCGLLNQKSSVEFK